MVAAGKRPPGLAAVLIGSSPASQVYVRNNVKTCMELGIYGEMLTLPESATTEDALKIVGRLNAREGIDGILVQLPLPEHINTQRVLLAVSPEKDVDGFHPLNIGNLLMGCPAPRPCTPTGIAEYLKRCQIPIAGRHAVVVGRSDIVGKPVAFLLLHEHATVTVCHSKTPDLDAVCRQADILVAAIGRPAVLTARHIREAAAVIDVGISRIEDREQAERISRDDAIRMAACWRAMSIPSTWWSGPARTHRYPAGWDE